MNWPYATALLWFAVILTLYSGLNIQEIILKLKDFWVLLLFFISFIIFFFFS